MPSHYRRSIEGWTVDRLRLALAGVPGHLPIRVLVPEEPGGDVAMQVVYDANVVDLAAVEAGRQPTDPNPRLWFEICCEFPPGG
jgi:hypothetical protein